MSKYGKTNNELNNSSDFHLISFEELDTLYKKYINDWCSRRGYNLENVDCENGINGECYACFEEFLDNEFQDEAYVNYLRNLKI